MPCRRAVMNKETYILAIESSCDETSAAVLKGEQVLSNLIATQEIHEEYGGVVPEFASREHQKNILPVVEAAVSKAGIELEQISAIAYTMGPGLLGSLLVGTSFAKGLSISLGKPLIEVNHMQAHILVHFIEDGSPKPEFPFLCLTVSGGHTQIIKVDGFHKFELLGDTKDDAAGEAFDKLAKIVGLPYPGGPQIDKLAKLGNPDLYEFPKADMPNLDMSFSGLKTAVLYFVRSEIEKDSSFLENHLEDLCASVQQTIVETLLEKLEKAAISTNVNHLALAGGVSANSLLRSRFEEMCTKNGWHSHIPKFEYCTDNAAMIGIAGYFGFINEQFSELSTSPKARMSI